MGTRVFAHSGTVLHMLHMYKHEHIKFDTSAPEGRSPTLFSKKITGCVQRHLTLVSFTPSSASPTLPHLCTDPRLLDNKKKDPPGGFSSRPPVQNIQKSPLAFFRFTCFQPGRPPYSSLLISRAFCRSSRAHRQQKAAPAPSLGYQNS